MQEGYSYSNQPQAAPIKSGRKNKYRDEQEDSSGGRLAATNIMHDPRVFRGSNVANKLLSSSLQDKKTNKEIVRRVDRKRLPYNGLMRGSTPPPVNGRQHADIQTEEFLEVLSDRPEETEMATQTLAELDRPSSPLFVRAKTGVDVETEIAAGDLFDFDLEVEPLLEVLVGRTIHVAMLEVMQEEELAAIRQQQEEFEGVRNVELAEVQRLEAEARRKTQEKQRRVQQEQQRIEEQRRLEAKVAARAFAQQYLSLLHEEVFDVLEAEGQFVDPLLREVEELFMPQLLQGVQRHFLQYTEASDMLLAMLEQANQEVAAAGEEALRLRQEREEEEAAEQMRLEEESNAAALEAKMAAAALEAIGDENNQDEEAVEE